MSTTIEVALRTDAAEGPAPDVVVIPVARMEESLRVPVGLRAEVAGVDIPSTISPDFAKRHGFGAKVGEVLIVSQAQEGPTLMAVGIGDPTASDDEAWRRAGAAIVRSAKGSRAMLLATLPSTVTEARLGEAIATGALLASYRFDRKSTEPSEGLVGLDVVPVADGGVSVQAVDALAAGIANGVAVAGAVAVARDLVNRHPSEVTLGGLLGVAKGSKESPRLLIAEYDPRGFEEPEEEPEVKGHRRKFIEPTEPTAPPEGPEPRHIVLVGKGVTFDSGGLSLKTAAGMTTMKTDMSGAAIVMAAMTVLDALDVQVRVTAIAPMSENMPGGSAMKPGDVLKARNGMTIEVLNTDAEGRLLLADGLSLAVEREPDAIIDVATLTGAAVVALGTGVAAILGNDDALVEGLIAAGEAASEPLWRLPLVEAYESHIDSDMADMKNIGSAGEAGTISAGLFLQRFTGSVPWAHLDIAGTGRSDKSVGYLAKGGTAFSLRTLLGYLRAQS